MAAQIILAVILTLELGYVLAMHGKEKTGTAARYNGWVSLFSSIFLVLLLWWGGFWDCFVR
jgi:hypothetical protein